MDYRLPTLEELAERDESFRVEYERVRRGQKMFKELSSVVDHRFNVALARALLTGEPFRLLYFDVPEGHLCPPVPNRFNYVKWLLDLINPVDSSTLLKGIDIGTGASAIYPLLFVSGAGHACTKMLGTDVDRSSVEHANALISANDLTSRISVVLTDAVGNPLQHALAHFEDEDISFVMMNPPFYSSKPGLRDDGRARTSMTDSESVYPGGEVAFVTEIIMYSLRCPHRIRFFSAMISKRASLEELLKVLKQVGVGKSCTYTTEFKQGKVKRFGLAWSFEDCRLTFKLSPPLSVSMTGVRIDEFIRRQGIQAKFDRIVTEETVTIRFDCESLKDRKIEIHNVIMMLPMEINRTSRRWRRKATKVEAVHVGKKAKKAKTQVDAIQCDVTDDSRRDVD